MPDTGNSAPLLSLRVPTNRLIGNNGDRLNVGVQHVDVDVFIDHDLPTLGKHEALYGGDRITLREWNEQVLLHELLHVVIARAGLDHTDDDPHLHNVISRVEVALWESGWRWHSDAAHNRWTMSLRLARRWFGRCTCRWEPASVLGLDTAERVTSPACPRHGTRVFPPAERNAR